MAKSIPPPKLRPFIHLGFDYDAERVTGKQAYADCTFCGSVNKLYINVDEGLWSCKSGKCQLEGNLNTFIQLWYDTRCENDDSALEQAMWSGLEKDRKLPQWLMKREGVVRYDKTWYIPIRNAKGNIVGLRYYIQGQGIKGLAEIDANLFGMELLADDSYSKDTIYLCEGEWDTIAMRVFLEENRVEGVAVGVPGAGVWKDSWGDMMIGRPVVICYDHDTAGLKGLGRVWGRLLPKSSKLECIVWPESLPQGYDVRDFVTGGGKWHEFSELVGKYVSEEDRHKQIQEQEKTIPKGSLSDRPKFSTVVEVFKDHLHMSEDMVTALRIIFATVLANSIQGDPLWIHIVSPPGTAKTELLLPLSGCPSCYFTSTLTTHSLVSGFVTQGGGDPSLLPLLNGKTFVLKDFTEILSMPKPMKDEIYGTLRGAYDGRVQKHYGNGLQRDYEVRFNMISGVTHAIFGERTTSLGERFLVFHLVKGVGNQDKDSIRAAIHNVGKESSIRHDLHNIVRQFVEVEVKPESIPVMPEEMIDKIIALSSLVAMLRATVEKSYSPGGHERMLYRPQHEMGTRLGKQLSKLAYGLSLVNTPPSLGEKEYEIVTRVALDTCVGLNLEAVAYIVSNPGQLIEEIAEAISIPITTLREQLEDMSMLNIVWKERIPNPIGKGAPRYLYHPVDAIVRYWKDARLDVSDDIKALPETREINRSVRRVRRVSDP